MISHLFRRIHQTPDGNPSPPGCLPADDCAVLRLLAAVLRTCADRLMAIADRQSPRAR
jgi:hypothetical protein